jgi:hypothetical protein
MTRKNCLVICVILLLSPICLCMGSLAYVVAYQNVGRITDFRPVSDGYEIPNTDYKVRVTRVVFDAKHSLYDEVYELALENRHTQQRFEVGRWTGCSHWCLPDFTFFKSNHKSYFMIGYPGHGSIHFQIFNISETTLFQVSPNDSNRNEPFSEVYAACVAPMLIDNKLRFEYDFDCDA